MAASEHIADIEYVARLTTTRLNSDVAEVERRLNESKKKHESKPYTVRFDFAPAERDFKQFWAKLERSVKPIKVRLDTSEAERQIDQLVARLGGNGGGGGLGRVSSITPPTGGGMGGGIAAAAAVSSRLSVLRATPAAVAMRHPMAFAGATSGYNVQGKSCPQCGDVSPENAVFCKKCGHDHRGGLVGRVDHFLEHNRFAQVGRAANAAVMGVAGGGLRGAGMAVRGANAAMNFLMGHRPQAPKTLDDVHSMIGGVGLNMTEALAEITGSTRGASQTLGDIRDLLARQTAPRRRSRRRPSGGNGGGDGGLAPGLGIPPNIRGVGPSGGLVVETGSETVARAVFNAAAGGTMNVTSDADRGHTSFSSGNVTMHTFSRPGRLGRPRWKGAGGAPVAFGGDVASGPMDPLGTFGGWSSNSAMQVASIPMMGQGFISGSMTGTRMGYSNQFFWPVPGGQGAMGGFTPVPFQAPGGPRMPSRWQTINGMGGLGNWLGGYQQFAQQTLGLSPGLARVGVGLGVGAGLLGAANAAANVVGGMQGNALAALNMQGRSARWVANNMDRDALNSAALGGSGVANLVSNLPGVGGALRNVAGGLVDGWAMAFGRPTTAMSLMGAKRGFETADNMRGLAFNQRSTATQVAMAMNTDKYNAFGLAAADQIESLEQSRILDRERFMEMGKRGLADRSDATYRARQRAARAVANREAARARRTDSAHFASAAFQMDNAFDDVRAAGRAGIAAGFIDALNSDDPTTSRRASSLMHRALRNEARQYGQDTGDLAADNAAGMFGVRAGRAAVSGNLSAAARLSYAGQSATIDNALHRQLRNLNMADPMQSARAFALYGQADVARGAAANERDQSLVGTQQYRIGVRLGTAGIKSATRQAQFANAGMSMSATAQGIVDEGLAGITQANAELYGSEFAKERTERIGAIRSNVAERLRGIQNQMMWGNRGEWVSAYTSRGDAQSQTMRDMNQVARIASGAMGSLDSAATKTTPGGQGGQGFTPQQAADVVRYLAKIAENAGGVQ